MTRKAVIISMTVAVVLKWTFAFGTELPDITEVQKAALDYARIRPDELSDMKKRARRAAMLPYFQIGMKQTIQNNVNVAINDNVSVTSSGTSIGPETSDIKQDANNDTALEVKAVWNLNELIFNSDMLDVAQETRLQMRERRQLMAEVNKLYFDLEKIDGGIIAAQTPALLLVTREEVIAGLDALTGGWFSEQLK